MVPQDVVEARREDWTKVVRFLTGHYHLGSWPPSQNNDIYDLCSFGMEAFSREHLIWECEELEMDRHATLGQFVDRARQDLAWLIWVGSAPLGSFLCGAHDVAELLYDERSFSDYVGID